MAMIQWRPGRVTGIGRSWSGAVECTVEVGERPADGRSTLTALAYPALTGTPRVGDAVLVNTTALEAGLGTGGYAFVVALPDRVADVAEPSPGHLVKARYTPQQVMVLGVDEPASPHHETLREADDLAGLPVVVADLHSALPAVLAGIRAERPGLRVAYLMSDGAALPAWFSRTVAELRSAGWLDCCISAGQAFGGDLEAVTVHSGLLAARLVVGADLAVVAQGPGVLGTGTRWGFSGVQVGEAVNAAAVLGGRPVAALRISASDPRARHRGVSHHSLTALGRVALAPCDVVLPVLGEAYPELDRAIRDDVAHLAAPTGRHRLVEVEIAGLRAALETSPVPLSTMGRGLDQDPPAFLAAAAAGRHAARLVAE